MEKFMHGGPVQRKANWELELGQALTHHACWLLCLATRLLKWLLVLGLCCSHITGSTFAKLMHRTSLALSDSGLLFGWGDAANGKLMSLPDTTIPDEEQHATVPIILRSL